MNDIHYNNGKVKIGSAYCLNPLRRTYIEEDKDMLKLQKYLINDPSLNESIKETKLVILSAVMFVFLIVWLRNI
jgi:hypothetical protein